MLPRMLARGLAVAPFLLAIAMLVSCKEEVVVEPEPTPRPIKIYRLEGQQGATRPDYPGRIKAIKVVELAFEVEGRIIDWNVEEGQRVKKGEILSRLDPRDYQAQSEAARARLRLAEAEYRRESKLFASGSGTQRDLDVATRSRDVSRAELRITQKALEDTRLRATFDGVIARKLVTDFRNVAAREPVLLLQDESVMEVVVDVPERDLAGAQKRNQPRGIQQAGQAGGRALGCARAAVPGEADRARDRGGPQHAHLPGDVQYEEARRRRRSCGNDRQAHLDWDADDCGR